MQTTYKKEQRVRSKTFGKIYRVKGLHTISYVLEDEDGYHYYFSQRELDKHFKTLGKGEIEWTVCPY